MADLTNIRGDGWFGWYCEERHQWVIRWRLRPGTWRMHRVPKTVQHSSAAERYAKVFAKEKKVRQSHAPPVGNGVISPDMTFGELGELWTTGKLAALYPRYIKRKKSADSDEARLRHYIYEHIGKVAIRDFAPPQGLELAEEVMAELPPPSELSHSTARHVAQVMSRVLSLAVYPLRILPVHPLPRGFLPKRTDDKAKTYVYPDEDAQLMRCRKVPLVERLFYGFLIREGTRAGEVRELQLYELDLVHGWGHLDETKNGKPKDWALHPGTVEGLKRYRDRFMASKHSHTFVFAREDGRLLDQWDLAEHLRNYLKLAGVKRSQLFLANQNRIMLRAHDLRASFVTVSLAQGRSEAWVMDRTGHMSSQMLQKYRRLVRGHREQGLGDFVPLCDAIPELRERASRSDGDPGSKGEAEP